MISSKSKLAATAALRALGIHAQSALASCKMANCLWRRLMVAMTFAVVAPATLANSTVTVSGEFYQYEGPVGAPIYAGYAGSPPTRDTAQYESYFETLWGQQVRIDPQFPHPGYEDLSYDGTGTASVNFYNTTNMIPTAWVQFWNRVDGQPDPLNILYIEGAVTQGVTIDPGTNKSNTFKLATFHFLNGSWFGTQPFYDPGLGPLYGASKFAFSLVAEPIPYIGSLTNPGGVSLYHFWNDTLVLTSTFGPSTPDLLSFENNPNLGSVSVAEGTFGTFEVWGQIGSLDPLELRNPSVGVTLIPIPEPNTWALLLAGLGLVGWAARQRRMA